MTRATAIVAAILTVVLAATAQAGTTEAEKEARTHFQAGETHFKAGEFDEALAEYQKGYDAKPLPGFLVNIAQCQRRLGDLKKARATYQKFILVAPDSPLVPQVRSMIAEIDGLLEKDQETPAGEAGPEAKPEVAVPEPAPEPAPPVLVATAPTPAPAAAPETAHRRWWLWGAIGAVVVGGAVTAVVLSTGGTTTIHDGSLATLRR